ncbi:DUF4112 domain-containing protein [Aurantiacibacter aquimixticola]|uniref:DUF4112 domain-containing protein n=1 Tax=Aurantiacibacter aquimixticola TaxID=1958945 RepID=A0A419RVA4_9SPHN|nr:DUF4112 domain-containing protein [Aurantiacibacter aquimixticola]RJY09709.1 DUF4112 domain-containing protein [Aurantiacibacter aquimixticola]
MDDSRKPVPIDPDPLRADTIRPERIRPNPVGLDLPLGNDPQSVRRRIEAMEMVLERSFVIPGTNRPVGLDAIIGLIPVVGDIIAMGLGAYIVWEARNLNMPKWKLLRMAGNVAFDSAVGAVPLAGDVFDFLFRSNSRNLRIVKKHLDKHHPESRVIDQ